MITADHNLHFLQKVESVVASVTVSLCCVGVEGVLKLWNVELRPINFAATGACLCMHALTHSYTYSPHARTLIHYTILHILTSHRSGRAERRLHIKVFQVTATTSSTRTHSEEVLLTPTSGVVTIVTMLFVD